MLSYRSHVAEPGRMDVDGDANPGHRKAALGLILPLKPYLRVVQGGHDMA